MTGPSKSKPPILILAGGKGTRLRSVNPSLPKPMVPVLDKPFLYWLVRQYVQLGYDQFVISTGYLAEFIEQYDWKGAFPGAHFRFYREDEPLGTGGAVSAIFDRFSDLNQVWVVNGDTLLESPLPDVIGDDMEALYTALQRGMVFDAEPNLCVENDQVVAEGVGGTVFDAGAVLVTRAALQRGHLAGDITLPCSIHAVLKASMLSKKVRYQVVPGTCFDIGTPDRLKRFESYLKVNS